MKFLIALFLLFFLSSHAIAVDWQPTKSVRVIIAQAPGSGNELAFRKVAKEVSEKTGVKFFIEHRTGMDGAVAINVFGHSKNDGHTIMVQSFETVLITVPALYQKHLQVIPDKFKVATIIGAASWVFVVPVDSPIKSVADLLMAYRQQKIKVGISGSTAMLLHMALIDSAGGQNKDIVLAPYKSGPTNINDLLAGYLDVSVAPAISAKGLAEAGKIRIIASSDDQPLSSSLQIPMLKDTLPNVVVKTSFTLFLPVDTDDKVVDWYSKHFADALQIEEVHQWFRDSWSSPFMNAGRKQSDRFIAETARRLKPVASKVLKPVD